jgi:glutaredoxin-dependent peroxiredoxin
VAQSASRVRRYVEDVGLPFFVLVDEDRAVTKQYGVWHRLGLDAWNIARPAVFVIDRDGTIRAVFVGESQAEFPSTDEIETCLKDLEPR